jgi:hypothetical protein
MRRHTAVFLALALAAGAAQAQQAPARVIAPDSSAEKGAKDPDKARLEISGKVQLDMIYDFKRVDPQWNMTLRPSKIPVNCPGDAGCGKDGETVMSVRQSSIAFKGFVPTTAGEIKTELSLDLFNVGSANTAFRLLNAWAELGSWGAGQTYTLFMNIDTFPNTIDYWGPAGMIFIRNPQLRYTSALGGGSKLQFSLEAPYSAIDTGKVAVADPTLNVVGRTKLPDVVAKWSQESDRFTVQLAGVARWIGYETPSNPNNDPSGNKTGYGVNVNGWYNLFKDSKDRITGQLIYGKGIASYMNDGGVDLAPNGDLTAAETVKTKAGFLYYDHYWSEKWSSSFGGSMHEQENTDGQLGNAFHKGSYASANLLFYPAKNVLTGGEILFGKRENKNGDKGDDSRIQFSVQYKF